MITEGAGAASLAAALEMQEEGKKLQGSHDWAATLHARSAEFACPEKRQPSV
jgi:hypothetical protein